MAKLSSVPLSGYTDTPAAPLHSYNTQDSSMSLPTQDTLAKQFIPVAVLLAFLCLLLASHLLRYPRILYIPPHLRDSPILEDRQRRGYIASGRTTFHSTSSLEVSLPKAKGTKALEMIALYSRPTVRLVQGYNNRSTEPRGRLIDEITLPYSSPTLVGSSSSDHIVPEPESHDIPPRVYLPPTLPEIFDYRSLRLDKPEDTHIIDIVKNSEPQHVTPLSSPIAPTFMGLRNLPETSPDEQSPPFEDMYPSSAMLSPNLQEPGNKISDAPISPELSPPPAALIHPILVRRALFPWRRMTSSEVSPEVIPVQELMGKADPIRRHRPSVPSRLRYFITRSASTSLSSSRTRSTPESSLGRRSRKSLMATEKSNRENSLSDVESHVGAYATHPPNFITAFPERAQDLFLPVNEVSHDLTADEAPEISLVLQSDDHPSFFEPISSAETSDVSVESPETSSSDSDNENGQGGEVAKAKRHQVSGWFSASEMRRESNGYRTLLGLGLRTPESIPGSLPSESIQPSRFLPDNDTGTSRAEDPADGEQDEDSRHASETGNITALSPGLSLRTVFSRWMNWGYGDPQHTIEEGNGSLEGDVGAADESVEVMVLNRWAGLESV